MTPPTPTQKRIDIERVSQMDLTVLASDRGAVPMNIGAVLEFDEPAVSTLASMRNLLEVRVPGVSRLRQKLYRPPFGCGRPVWVDDPDFRLDDHLSERAWPAPGSRRELLDIAADLVCRRLDADRPLWRAWLVTGQDQHRAALVMVMHHVLADGLGGLATLAALADGGPWCPIATIPGHRPGGQRLPSMPPENALVR